MHTRFRASSQACLSSDTLALLTLITSRSSSLMMILSGRGGGRLSDDSDRAGEPFPAGFEDGFLSAATPLACFLVRAIKFLECPSKSTGCELRGDRRTTADGFGGQRGVSQGFCVRKWSKCVISHLSEVEL